MNHTAIYNNRDCGTQSEDAAQHVNAAERLQTGKALLMAHYITLNQGP